MNTFTPARGSRKTSSAVWAAPSGPARKSSKLIGLRSAPGPTTLPTRVVPATGVRFTVVKALLQLPPGVPLPSASSNWPSPAARILSPSSCRLMRVLPGRAASKSSQARFPCGAITMVAGRRFPAASVAQKLSPVTVAGSTGRLKLTWGRKVAPTSPEPSAGLTASIVSGMASGRRSVRVVVVLRPAPSCAVSVRVWAPIARLPRLSGTSKVPVWLSNTSGRATPLLKR